jgi:hypothetical protein
MTGNSDIGYHEEIPQAAPDIMTTFLVMNVMKIDNQAEHEHGAKNWPDYRGPLFRKFEQGKKRGQLLFNAGKLIPF